MALRREKRHKRIRNKISGTTDRPRISIYRSNKHIQMQLIDDVSKLTLMGISTKNLSVSVKGVERSKELGKVFAQMILQKDNGKYKTVVFDRGGYKYHGNVKAVADSLREGGIIF